MVKILFLSANPLDTSPLRIDEEIRAIDEKLRWAEYRDLFEIKQQWAVRVTDLQEHLLRHQPHIVHFSGHGSPSSAIILQDNLGVSQPVSANALSRLFATLKDNIQCVVLNACYSEEQARAIAEHIECVVGMSKAITDASAIHFAASFYQALGYGRSIKTAFDLGCGQIDLAGLDELETPKLLTSNSDPSSIFFAPSREIDKTPSLKGQGIPYVATIYGSSYVKDTSTLCKKLGIALAQQKYRIASGGGPGAGLDVSRSAYEYLKQYNVTFADVAITFVCTPKRKETLVPFGQVIDVPDVENLRKELIHLGWGSIFIGGSKGTWEEYQELKHRVFRGNELRDVLLPIGSTGGAAQQIWTELASPTVNIEGIGITPEEFTILNDNNASVDVIVNVVMRVLNGYRRWIH